MDPVAQNTDHENPEALLASFGAFIDFLQIDFDFLWDDCFCFGASDAVERFEGKNFISLATEKSFDIDLKLLGLVLPDMRLCAASVTPQPDGGFLFDDLHAPFESLESHLGSMAVKIYHRGNSRLGRNPYVSVKLNPTKLTYGCNAFSDIRTVEQALLIGLSAFVRACPELAALVDVARARVMRIDTTSGVQCATVADVDAMLRRLANVQIRHVHAAGTMPVYSDAEQKLRKKCGDTVYFNGNSEHQRGCVYAKGPEARRELKELTVAARRDPGNAALAARVAALSDAEYQKYCDKLLRFEARTMRRGLHGALDRHGITDWDGTVFDLIRCEKQLAETGTDFVKRLWAHVWRPVMTALWGDPDMTIANETRLEQQIAHYYEKNFTGRARSMGQRRAMTHLRAIIDRGWDSTKNSPPASQASWYRTINELVDAGISRAALQSCKGDTESRLAAGVVVSFRSVLEVQAVNAAPSWFKPADLSRWMDDSDLMQVPHRHRLQQRRAVGDGLVDCVGQDQTFCGPLDTRPDTDAEICSFLDRSAGHGLGSHAGQFPPEVDWDAVSSASDNADLRVPTVTRAQVVHLIPKTQKFYTHAAMTHGND
ncbi:phage/plasmid replication protein, II/X family [Aeromonas caviae]